MACPDADDAGCEVDSEGAFDGDAFAGRETAWGLDGSASLTEPMNDYDYPTYASSVQEAGWLAFQVQVQGGGMV